MLVRMCGGGNDITKRTMRGSKLCVESIHAQCYYGAHYVNVRTTNATLEPHPRPMLAKVSALRLTHLYKASVESIAVYTNTL